MISPAAYAKPRHFGTGIPDPILFREAGAGIPLFGTGRLVCTPLCRRLNIIVGAPIDPILVLGLVKLCSGVSEWNEDDEVLRVGEEARGAGIPD